MSIQFVYSTDTHATMPDYEILCDSVVEDYERAQRVDDWGSSNGRRTVVAQGSPRGARPQLDWTVPSW